LKQIYKSPNVSRPLLCSSDQFPGSRHRRRRFLQLPGSKTFVSSLATCKTLLLLRLWIKAHARFSLLWYHLRRSPVDFHLNIFGSQDASQIPSKSRLLRVHTIFLSRRPSADLLANARFWGYLNQGWHRTSYVRFSGHRMFAFLNNLQARKGYTIRPLFTAPA
jgi:hypothetical protein